MQPRIGTSMMCLLLATIIVVSMVEVTYASANSEIAYEYNRTYRTVVTQQAVIATATHIVRSGESLWEIARMYGTDVATLLQLNHVNNPNIIQVGQSIKLKATPQPYTVQPGDSMWSIAKKFRVKLDDILKINNLRNPEMLQIDQKILIPAGANPALASRSSKGIEYFSWPIIGKITSPFGKRHGEFHTGIDIAAKTGTPIKASRSGTVITVGWCGNYGKTVVVDHGNNLKTRYAHTSKILVHKGDYVHQGQIIANVGSTGRSTGPHLHFEIVANKECKDPTKYLSR